MNIKILYFGMISEILNCNEEILVIENNATVTQLESFLINKYESLKKLSFKIVVNQTIPAMDTLLKPNYEIALLPPFSGG